ncbi:MAG TPA: TolC family protein [Cyclobacteriaceae bacterium]|nr:TolC family protein [Cyclobacteriaceae bacterium]
MTSLPLFAQQDSTLQNATLTNVVAYAMKHQPLIQQSMIDQETTETTIKSKLADWYPQINFNYNYLHNFVLQPNYAAQIGGVFRFGVTNSSLAQFALTQNIFNRDVALASKTATNVRLNAQQTTSSRKIDLAVSVTKAFYDVLATQQQIKVGLGDIIRLRQSLKTAYDQYAGGLVDKIDYKRATITLSNTQAVLKSNQEALKYKVEYLKSLMGYPIGGQLNISYDTSQMENEIQLDTLQTVEYQDRIDYKLLSTQRKLQEANLKYNQWSFLPTVSLSGSYNFYYLGLTQTSVTPSATNPNGIALTPSDRLGDVYKNSYPYSLAMLNVTVPIFQGGKRISNIKQQKWTLQRLDWDIKNLKNAVNSQYTQALAAYKANLITYQTLKQNVELAKEVFEVVQLQYKSGVKTYLEVITAETDLRTARINYFNALYAVLSSKIDVQKALGQINY